MKEIKNNSISLQQPNWTCDGFHKDVPNPMPQSISFFMIIVGSPGSGKSSLGINLLCNKGKNKIYRKKYNWVYLFCPENSLNSLKNNPFKNLPDEQIFHEFDLDNLLILIDTLEKNAEQGETSLIFIDDLASSLKDGGKEVLNLFLRLVFNRRHLKCAIVLAVQRLYTIPKSVRSVATDIILFPPSNKVEKQIIFNEYIPIGWNNFRELSKFAWRDGEKHSTLYHKINTNDFYRNFNKIEFTEEENDKFFG